MDKKLHPFHKTLSFGVPYNISPFDMSKIVYTYHDLIHDLYTSPFVITKTKGLSYTNKDFITDAMENNPRYLDTFKQALILRRKYNLNLDVAINGKGLQFDHLEVLKNYLLEYNPSEMTVLEDNVDDWRNLYPDMTFYRSHNNPALRVKHFEDTRFNCYIGAKQFLWHPKLWPDDPYKLRLLVNNACLYTCPGCFEGKDLNELADKEVMHSSIEAVSARTSLYPEDMKLVVDYYPHMTFKLNTRNRGGACFKLLKDIKDITPTRELFSGDGALERHDNYNAWHKHGSLQAIRSEMGFDLDRLMEEKYKLQENFKKEAEEMLNTRHAHILDK